MASSTPRVSLRNPLCIRRIPPRVQANAANDTFKPLTIRSGEHGDIGGRRSMEDASVCLDDVVVDGCPDSPLSFYGVSIKTKTMMDYEKSPDCYSFYHPRPVHR